MNFSTMQQCACKNVATPEAFFAVSIDELSAYLSD